MVILHRLFVIVLCVTMTACGCVTVNEPPLPQYDYSAVKEFPSTEENTINLSVMDKTYTIPLYLGEQTVIDCCNAISVIHTFDSVDADVERTEDYDMPYVITASKDGTVSSAEELFKLIENRSDNEISYEPRSKEPKVSSNSLMAQNSMLSQFTTSFNKSSLKKENRVFNIKKAASLINGVIVDPNKVFSTNKTIGDRNRRNGWKKAAAISGGTYVEEYGGGVCQVSSTLFNAVMMADLEIVERHHHSWPMSYVPIGRDATISTGIKDFCFRNNTDYPITIFADVNSETNELSICIYGMKNEAFSYIEIESEKTGYEDSLPTEYRLDESLPNGTEIVEREGRRGRRSVTYKLYYSEDGTLIERVVAFKDTYPSIAEIVYRSADLYY